MTKKCSEGLDLIFFHVLKHQKFFDKIEAPLVQKCSALPEYSLRKYESFIHKFFMGQGKIDCVDLGQKLKTSSKMMQKSIFQV